jgi:hypothetical protein
MNRSKKDQYLPFEDARKYARSLQIKTREEWVNLRRAGKIPANVPTSPDTFYRFEWEGWRDWVGFRRKMKRSPYKKRIAEPITVK